MNQFKDIAPKFISLAVLILYHALITFSNNDLIPGLIELSGGNCLNHHSVISYADSSVDDQFSETEEYLLFPDEMKCDLSSEEISLIPFPKLPIWQPPRIHPKS
ncbi:MAG: hypothetical protein IPH84_14105 [Bacteroidales bacterium]|nr:hypothetical protein [Bacteroidales bacterium]